MSAPDYRYLQAWARPSAAKSSSSGGSSRRPYESGTSYEAVLPTSEGDASTPADKHAQQQSAYQVRLDVPGGISYAPDALAQHNSVKRLFIPATMHDRSAKEYDFAREIEAKRKAATSKALKDEPELDEQGRTQAQAYKESVQQSEATASDQGDAATPFMIPDSSRTVGDGKEQEKDSDAASVLTNATAASVQSKMTTLTLAAERTQTLPMNVSANAVTVPFRPPPSITGDAANAQTPWNTASNWTSHRALDRLTDKEKKLGITQFEEATEGRVPSAYEASLFPASASDAATIKTMRPGELLVEDLFVPDPRPWRPLRYVRKIDPRQMLILCAGAALTPGQVEAMKFESDASPILTSNTATRRGPSDAASIYSSVPTDFSVEATRKAMFGAGKLPDYKSLEAQLKTASTTTDFESEEKRAGLGFVFCPTHDPRSRQPSYKRSPEVTVEPNFSRRLERPPDFSTSTLRRAALRSALAALEFTKWESEGFDKIVVATHHGWLVDGVSRWIWEWRHNKWRIMTESPLGMIGEQVPDRDLWELLDKAVKGYEEIDCTVRFWKISKEQNAQAVLLAQEGACKDNQQPGTVRWTKKRVPAST